MLAAVLLPVGHSADAVSLQETAPDLVTPELRANPMFTFVDCADGFWDQVCGNGNDDLSPNLPPVKQHVAVVEDGLVGIAIDGGPGSCFLLDSDGEVFVSYTGCFVVPADVAIEGR